MKWIAAVLALAACGPVVSPQNEDSTSSSGDGPTSSTATTSSPFTSTTSEPSTTVPGTSVGVDTDTTTGDPTDSGSSFIVVSDHDMCGGSQCDVWGQDCPDGEQCNASDHCGTPGTWSSTRCAPIDPDPGSVGEPCTVLESPYSGLESCGEDALCFAVDPVALTGTCVALCTGSPNNPLCTDPNMACLVANDGVLNLCLPACDPLLPDCAVDEACHPIAWQQGFVCMPLDAPIVTDQHPTACPPGTTDVDSALLPSVCDADDEVCCASYCDVMLGDAECVDGLACTLWWERLTFFDNPGICIDPPR